MRISKKKILLGAPVVALPLVSLQAFFGAVLGYFLAKILAGKNTGEPGKIKSLSFNIGSFKVHLHHWLLSAMVLSLALYYNFLSFYQFSFGLLGGIIFQGIYSYSDWHKILVRKK
jgi:hypothetical protein